jgi:hypothetical protein
MALGTKDRYQYQAAVLYHNLFEVALSNHTIHHGMNTVSILLHSIECRNFHHVFEVFRAVCFPGFRTRRRCRCLAFALTLCKSLSNRENRVDDDSINAFGNLELLNDIMLIQG